MKRAAVLIGVKQSGGLIALPATHAAVEQMRYWLQDSQSLPDELIKVVVDDAEPVTVKRIRDAVTALAKDEDIEQLVVYFCGHGIVNNQSELWLLSSGPEDPDDAAVNVERSEHFARHSVFGHVIFISDACRTAAPDFQYQQVGGSAIFRSSSVLRPQERSVDRYFACGLNMPSHQTKVDPKGPFESIYTRTLVSALRGDYREVVCVGKIDEHPGVRQVHGWGLKKLLRVKVPQEMEAAGVVWESWQTPDARINSEPTAWVSELGPELPSKPALPDLMAAGEMELDEGTAFNYSDSYLERMLEAADHDETDDLQAEQLGPLGTFRATVPDDPALVFTLREDVLSPMERLEEIPAAHLPSADLTVREAAARLIAADSTVPSHFESGKGFIIHGTTLARASGVGRIIQIDRSDDAAIVWSDEAVLDVLLVFGNGSGTVLPAITGFIASVTVDRDELVSVSYEPIHPAYRTDTRAGTGSHPDRWAAAAIMAPQLRETRALVAAMSKAGTFRLDAGGPDLHNNAELLARQIQTAKTYDPSMAVYAAYAYYDLQLTRRNLEMATFLSADLEMMFFDLALVTGSFSRQETKGDDLNQPFYPVYPRFPLLSRGWSLLPDHNTSEPSALVHLSRHVQRSLWTLFDAAGIALIEANPEILEMTDERIGFRSRKIAAESGFSKSKGQVDRGAERGYEEDQQATAY